jgi:hypothetical protein
MMRHLTLLALFTIVFAAPTFAQQCLHGPNEDAAQKARRVAALSVVRAVNSTEATVKAMKGQFLPLAELRLDLTKAQGFEPQFTMGEKSYSLILRDTTDPCHFVFSTNEVGIIYQGYPIDYEVHPVKPTQK